MSRSPEQVIAAARAIDRARADGVPAEVVAIMLAARAAWRGSTDWPPNHELARVVAVPQARQVDEVLWRVIRRRVRA